MQAKAAVVILNYNGKKFLELFLEKAIRCSAPHEVIIADNASTDDSVSYLERNFPKIKIIRNDRNYGYANGYNAALKHVKAEYLVLLNNDVELTENWLQPILNLMESDKKIAACQPKLLDYNSRNMFEYAGAAGGFIDNLGYPFCKGRIFNSIESDLNQYNGNHEVFWASGACMVIKADLFWKVNGFDGDYFAHMEEIDLCWRLKNIGYKIYASSESQVYHVGGGTLNKVNARKTFLNFRNSLITLTKNHPSSFLFFVIYFRMVLDGVAGLKFLLQGQGSHFIAVIKAHFSYYAQLGLTLKKRRSMTLMPGFKRTLNCSYRGNVVYLHFIKGINKFSELRGNFQ